MSTVTQTQINQAIAAFSTADTNNVNLLTSVQFYSALRSLNLGYSFAETFELYKGIDKNNDFGVSQTEFQTFMTTKGFANQAVDLTNAVNVKRLPGQTTGHFAESKVVAYSNNGRISHYTPTTGYTSTRPDANVYTSSTYVNPSTTNYTPISTSVVTTPQPVLVNTTSNQVNFYNPATSTIQTQSQILNYQQVNTTPNTHVWNQPLVNNTPVITQVQQSPVVVRQQVAAPVRQVVVQNVQPVQHSYVQQVQQPVQHSYVQQVAAPVRQVQYVQQAQPVRQVQQPVAVSALAQFDNGNKGYLNRGELRTACQSLGVRCETEEELESIFSEIDENKTGRINAREFQEFYNYVKGNDFASKGI